MKKSFSAFTFFLQKHIDIILLFITLYISVVALLYFFNNGQLHLSNYDAVARLNASRKTVDSITPGVGQLGGIWLPFPQVLMIPFIWNDYLWRSGLAGSFVSGLSFVVGALYLKKVAFFITKSLKASLLIWFIFVSNINVLLLSTMSMSEMFFMCCLILVLYHLSVWVKTHDLLHFLLIAFFVMLLTLTRYEGYFILLGTFIVIVLECIRAFKREREKLEGMLLLFLTVAGFGIILWCIYSALFYKDPFFWLHSYSQTSSSAVVQNGKTIVDDVYGNLHPNIIESLGIYSAVVFMTNGIITVALGLAGGLLYLRSIFKKTISKEKILMFMPVGIISIVLFAFLIIGYYVGFIPHIEFPPVYLTGTKIREWSIYADSNIRYGMVLLPCILLFIAFIAAKSKYLYYVTLFCIGLQLFAFTTRPQLLQYPFVASWRYPDITNTWFKDNYDGGLILISSSRHEDFMFSSGLPYKKFIYEGTREYWFDSLKNPSKYARWVIFNDRISGDGIVTNLTEKGYEILLAKFRLVYEDKGFKIYKLREK